ncbi:hypothetical protein HanPSC8_Chr05g0187411 [Helianthus annuus]|nr:hypothetical protein HanPSC8_Chr05g0187411 [Helianthus annuus]
MMASKRIQKEFVAAWGLGSRALFLVFFVKFRKYPVKFEFES